MTGTLVRSLCLLDIVICWTTKARVFNISCCKIAAPISHIFTAVRLWWNSIRFSQLPFVQKLYLSPVVHTHTHHFIVRHTPHCLSFLRCSLTIYDCQKDGQTRIRRACLLAPPAENRGTCHFVLCEFHGQNGMRRAGDTRCIVGQCVYAIQSYLLVSVCNTRSCFHPEPKLLKRTWQDQCNTISLPPSTWSDATHYVQYLVLQQFWDLLLSTWTERQPICTLLVHFEQDVDGTLKKMSIGKKENV